LGKKTIKKDFRKAIKSAEAKSQFEARKVLFDLNNFIRSGLHFKVKAFIILSP